ncbi:MAG TPA: efflux RND transporter periplasmic adaptor subunit [Bryobacteraceae bacterium]|nr:efflux RND transporter periplasmic adaptor subunit [Bryobacteraceae bacterium]
MSTGISRSGLLAAIAAAGGMLAGCGASGKNSSQVLPARAEAETVPVVETVTPLSRPLDMTVPLPGELQPYEEVTIYPKVTGFVQWIGVDRGSEVAEGQVLARLVAPEIVSQKAEAQANLRSSRNREVAAEAKLASDEGTFQRLKAASATPGVISEQELDVAQKAADGDRAGVVAMRESVEAAEAAVHAVETLEGYLNVAAPFAGVITERNVHTGALVGPASGRRTQTPLFHLEQAEHLRLVVAVPESYVAGVVKGARVNFTVPAFPGRSFSGSVARISATLDQQTRTMPVELDVWNTDKKLHSGMFPQVSWPVHRSEPSLFVPQSAVLRSLEMTYVIRIRSGRTEWVSVRVGATSGALVEVFGELTEGDELAARANEELRPNTAVSARPAGAGGGRTYTTTG